ncbi:hypothetical protein HanIR_Chr09g0432331 [Helianthus annuus]|nr:hypothetical protein HanIR_Chr09g0432331 [Helianthus annuus]
MIYQRIIIVFSCSNILLTRSLTPFKMTDHAFSCSQTFCIWVPVVSVLLPFWSKSEISSNSSN